MTEINMDISSNWQQVEYSEKLTALPPQYQREREIEEMMKNPKIMDALKGEEILHISERNEDNIYIIETENFEITVQIHYKNTHWIGPAQFETQFLEKKEKDQLRPF